MESRRLNPPTNDLPITNNLLWKANSPAANGATARLESDRASCTPGKFSVKRGCFVLPSWPEKQPSTTAIFVKT
jgi:hypothetical protein